MDNEQVGNNNNKHNCNNILNNNSDNSKNYDEQINIMDKKHIRFRKSFNCDGNQRIEGLKFDNYSDNNNFNHNHNNQDHEDDNDGEGSGEGEGGEEESEREKKFKKGVSFFGFIKTELTRGYELENDEERFSARREKIYSFIKIPREVEKFMTYGFLQCADSFLFVYTFLPLRFIMALWAIISRSLGYCFRATNSKKSERFLRPAEMCDLLKGIVVISCCVATTKVDTSIMYHLVKSQSVIKLYIFYNMLEVGDRLFSAFGQDTIDALLWTATEPQSRSRSRRRQHLGTLPHLLFAITYVILHSILVLLQATTLNVAINSSNKALLTIILSNNFVELKGSVFKKFDKSNLFQLSCADVRERFHLLMLLLAVSLQTMKEYAWKMDRLYILLPDCIVLLAAELIVDWIKHAFITRFNELLSTVYRDYTLSLAYDMAQTRQETAFSDPSDLVARRMGFIPLPLSVAMGRVLFSTLSATSRPSNFILFFIGYLILFALRILNSLIILGKACDLIASHSASTNQKFTDKTRKNNVFNRTLSVDHTNIYTHNHGANNNDFGPVAPLIVLNDKETKSGVAILSNSATSLTNVCFDDGLNADKKNCEASQSCNDVNLEVKTVMRAESEPLLP
ncbi:protein TAPT1 homolog [Microplitis demolitor]|uniref:protein TAPT1 homolog n=1 Tax=Microplitis demolitor TaxID=69319 RepID=UPI0004CD34CC|nr:protein TAPT1 homolog [Microplitis demolitor]